MAKIFVSYRRQDSPYVADTLKNHLEQRFGGGSVFFDIDHIPFGANFKKHIEHAVGQCAAMLVLIGDKWLAPVEPAGKNRLFEPHDYVRMEIEAALGRGIPVVPVLVDSAGMPAAEDLPESIQELIFHNAAEVRAGRDFQSHMTRLVDGLGSLLESTATTDGASEPPVSKKKRPAPESVARVTIVPKKERAAEPNAVMSPDKSRAQKKVARGARVKPSQPRLDTDMLLKAFNNCAPTLSGETYVGSAIPAGKLSNALAAYAPELTDSDVLLLHDSTFFGGARDGFLLTAKAIFWHNIGERRGTLQLHEVTNVEGLGIGVRVNGSLIMISDDVTSEALMRLLKGIAQRRP